MIMINDEMKKWCFENLFWSRSVTIVRKVFFVGERRGENDSGDCFGVFCFFTFRGRIKEFNSCDSRLRSLPFLTTFQKWLIFVWEKEIIWEMDSCSSTRDDDCSSLDPMEAFSLKIFCFLGMFDVDSCSSTGDDDSLSLDPMEALSLKACFFLWMKKHTCVTTNDVNVLMFVCVYRFMKSWYINLARPLARPVFNRFLVLIMHAQCVCVCVCVCVDDCTWLMSGPHRFLISVIISDNFRRPLLCIRPRSSSLQKRNVHDDYTIHVIVKIVFKLPH